MSGQMIEEIKDALKLHGRRLVDILYNASVLSAISVGAALLILFITCRSSILIYLCLLVLNESCLRVVRFGSAPIRQNDNYPLRR